MVLHILLVEFCTANLPSKNSVKTLFYQMLFDFRKSTACWKVPRLCPFVRLVRASYRRRWVWRNFSWFDSRRGA
jgi:hypothetical protein